MFSDFQGNVGHFKLLREFIISSEGSYNFTHISLVLKVFIDWVSLYINQSFGQAVVVLHHFEPIGFAVILSLERTVALPNGGCSFLLLLLRLHFSTFISPLPQRSEVLTQTVQPSIVVQIFLQFPHKFFQGTHYLASSSITKIEEQYKLRYFHYIIIIIIIMDIFNKKKLNPQ